MPILRFDIIWNIIKASFVPVIIFMFRMLRGQTRNVTEEIISRALREIITRFFGFGPGGVPASA